MTREEAIAKVALFGEMINNGYDASQELWTEMTELIKKFNISFEELKSAR